MIKRSFRTTFLVVSAALLLSACGEPEQLYSWNSYSSVILTHYKDATSAEAFSNELGEVVEKSEKKGNVPPGLYAEYGYALLEAGQEKQAILYFQKERDKWPEAQEFLDNVIARLKGTNSKQGMNNE